MKCVIEICKSRLFGFLVFFPIMLAAAETARAEVIHLDTLSDSQVEHAWPIDYVQNFNIGADIRVTDIVLRLGS